MQFFITLLILLFNIPLAKCKHLTPAKKSAFCLHAKKKAKSLSLRESIRIIASTSKVRKAFNWGPRGEVGESPGKWKPALFPSCLSYYLFSPFLFASPFFCPLWLGSSRAVISSGNFCLVIVNRNLKCMKWILLVNDIQVLYFSTFFWKFQSFLHWNKKL